MFANEVVPHLHIRNQVTRWAILTGEYPPQPGGVSDYTKLIAEGLASAGDTVDVVAPMYEGTSASANSERSGQVRVHRLPRGFHCRDFCRIENILSAISCERVLLQYVPHAFGWKGMNVPLARWVHGRLRAMAAIDVMFHEVIYPFSLFPLRHALLGKATEYMARQIAAAAERIFVSIPAWEPLIRRLYPQAAPITWLPIPSNVPTAVSADDVAIIRNRYGHGGVLLGHFGTYGPATTSLLSPALAEVLSRTDDTRVLLLGRGSTAYREAFVGHHPTTTEQVHAAGALPDDAVAAHIKACDLLLQPYVDGVSSRRSSVMPALACGVPVVSNLGFLSEPLWKERGIAVAPSPDASAIAAKCLDLLTDDALRLRTAQDGRQLYCDQFTLERSINGLRGTN